MLKSELQILSVDTRGPQVLLVRGSLLFEKQVCLLKVGCKLQQMGSGHLLDKVTFLFRSSACGFSEGQEQQGELNTGKQLCALLFSGAHGGLAGLMPC